MRSRTTLMTTLALATIAIMLNPDSTNAATLHVPDHYLTIQDAIQAAKHGDEILVAPGVHVGPIHTAGKALHIRSIGGPEQTIVGYPDVPIASPVVIVHAGETDTTIIEGFTIMGGLGIADAPGLPSEPGWWRSSTTVGGGVYINNAAPTIRNCIITGNNADLGGGLYANGQALIEDCVIEDNSASLRGGGAMLMGGATMRSTTIRGNASTIGGGLHLRDSIIVACVIEENAASEHGGGVSFATTGSGDEIALLSECVIRANFAGEFGGGIGAVNDDMAIGSVTLRASRCLIQDNEALYGAGVAVIASGHAALHMIDNSMILANKASIGVGGVFISGQNHQFDFTIMNCTIAGNEGSLFTAGVHHGQSAQLRIVNSILWGNIMRFSGNSPDVSDTEASQIQSFSGDGLFVSHCLITSLSAHIGSGNVNGDPRFVEPLGFDGEVGTEGADLRLRPGSRCIDAGHTPLAAGVLSGAVADFTGGVRLLAGDAAAPRGVPILGLHIDIGAIEFLPVTDVAPACPADLTGNGLVGSADLATMLGSWGVCP